ncbi:MAG: nuclease superfamily protein [Candidatus Peribacteria bacterium]|nr:nuclease superfamily protein [Candidatus Peribacteria bacterium]
MDHNYYVYVLRCSDGTYYIGVTNNYLRRLSEHQSGKDRFSYTASRLPVELMHVVYFDNIFAAISWEKVVKGWSRKKKEAWMRGDFEALPALSKNRQKSGGSADQDQVSTGST